MYQAEFQPMIPVLEWVKTISTLRQWGHCDQQVAVLMDQYEPTWNWPQQFSVKDSQN